MKEAVLIKGDGIGPEISESVIEIFKAAKVPIRFREALAGEAVFNEFGNALPQATIDSINDIKVALKAPLTTPVGVGFRSINVELRKKFNLFQGFRPVFNIKGIDTPFKGIDIVIFRENTEGLYSGIEYMIGKDTAQSIKVATRKACESIAYGAFRYAKLNGRKKVTIVHKANILKLTDGMFLDVARQIGKAFPSIETEDRIVDNMCMQLVQKPQQFDVILCPNLYGDQLSDLCAGLVGGLGVVGGANIGRSHAIFEAVHGTAPDIAGKNKANPTAFIMSAIMMLEYLKMNDHAAIIKLELLKALENKETRTGDQALGGFMSTSEFTDHLVSEISNSVHSYGPI